MKNQSKKKVMSMLKDVLKERRTSPESHRGDFLDQILKDTAKEKFLTEDFILRLIFGVLFGTFESISAIMALSFTKLSEHPSVLEGMIVSGQSSSISSFHYLFTFVILNMTYDG